MKPYRVLITRPEGQNDGLAARLREMGVEPVEVPSLRIEPPASWNDLDRAIARLDEFDWILVTSGNAVAAFFARLAIVAPERRLRRLRWTAIGSGTADALRERGVTDVWIPTRFTSDTLAEEMPAAPGERVLRLRGEVASETPARVLRVRGVDVVEVIAYRTIEGPPGSRERLARAMADGVDAVIFTSASAVRGLIRLAAEAGVADTIPTLLLVAIGPVTARALQDAGLRADIVAPVHTIDGIVNVVAERRTTGAGFPSR